MVIPKLFPGVKRVMKTSFTYLGTAVQTAGLGGNSRGFHMNLSEPYMSIAIRQSHGNTCNWTTNLEFRGEGELVIKT